MAYKGIAIVAAVATALSLYMTATSLMGTQPLGCGEGMFQCESLLATRWSHWLGLPVSAMAFAAYATVTGLAVACSFTLPDGVRKTARMMLLAGTAIVAASAFWFIALQAIVLKQYCIYCTVIHGCGLLTVFIAVSATEASLREIAVSLTAALIGGAILIVGQVSSWNQLPEKLPYLVVSKPDLGREATIRIPADSTEGIHFLAGQITIAPESRPMIGNPNAPRVVVKLFDYTCGYCRRLNGQLDELIANSPDEFAVVLIHIPMSPKCNPYRGEEVDRHAEACELTRIALAVWLTDSTAFVQLNRWLSVSETSRTATDARQEAERLIGKEALESALANERIDTIIAENVALYDLEEVVLLPSLLTAERIISGSFSDVDQLRTVLTDE